VAKLDLDILKRMVTGNMNTGYSKDWKIISRELLKDRVCDICGNKAEVIHHKNKQKDL